MATIVVRLCKQV